MWQCWGANKKLLCIDNIKHLLFCFLNSLKSCFQCLSCWCEMYNCTQLILTPLTGTKLNSFHGMRKICFVSCSQNFVLSASSECPPHESAFTSEPLLTNIHGDSLDDVLALATKNAGLDLEPNEFTNAFNKSNQVFCDVDQSGPICPASNGGYLTRDAFIGVANQADIFSESRTGSKRTEVDPLRSSIAVDSSDLAIDKLLATVSTGSGISSMPKIGYFPVNAEACGWALEPLQSLQQAYAHADVTGEVVTGGGLPGNCYNQEVNSSSAPTTVENQLNNALGTASACDGNSIARNNRKRKLSESEEVGPRKLPQAKRHNKRSENLDEVSSFKNTSAPTPLSVVQTDTNEQLIRSLLVFNVWAKSALHSFIVQLISVCRLRFHMRSLKVYGTFVWSSIF